MFGSVRPLPVAGRAGCGSRPAAPLLSGKREAVLGLFSFFFFALFDAWFVGLVTFACVLVGMFFIYGENWIRFSKIQRSDTPCCQVTLVHCKV